LYLAVLKKIGVGDTVDPLSLKNIVAACLDWLDVAGDMPIDLNFLKKYGIPSLQVSWGKNGPPTCLALDPFNRGFASLSVMAFTQVLSDGWISAHEDAGVDGSAFRTGDGTDSQPFLLPIVHPVFNKFTLKALEYLDVILSMLMTKTTCVQDKTFRYAALVHLSNGICATPLTFGSAAKLIEVWGSFKVQFKKKLAKEKMAALRAGQITLSTHFPIDMVPMLLMLFNEEVDLLPVLAEIFARKISYMDERAKFDMLRHMFGITMESLPSIHEKSPSFSTTITIDEAFVMKMAEEYTNHGVGRAMALALRFRDLKVWERFHAGQKYDDVINALTTPIEPVYCMVEPKDVAAAILQSCFFSTANSRSNLPRPTEVLHGLVKQVREHFFRQKVKEEEERLKQVRLEEEERRVEAVRIARRAEAEGIQQCNDLVYGVGYTNGRGGKKMAKHVIAAMLRGASL